MTLFEEMMQRARTNILEMAYHNDLPMNEVEYNLDRCIEAAKIIGFVKGFDAAMEMANENRSVKKAGTEPCRGSGDPASSGNDHRSEGR